MKDHGTGQPASDAAPILKITDLRIATDADSGSIELVHGVSIDLHRGEVLGLVGQSGSGKTLTCRAALGVLPAGCVVTRGSIAFEKQDLLELDERGWRKLRSTRIGAVFQDPASFLNPALTVGRQVSEVLRVKGGLRRHEARQRAIELFDLMGLRNPEKVYRQIPSELSGGMQQRVMMALAVSCDPVLLVADEPTSSLDVKTQSEVLALLRSLRERLGLSILFVSHDLAVVADLCDRVAVFQNGFVVETGAIEQIVCSPSHAYTRSLWESSATDISGSSQLVGGATV